MESLQYKIIKSDSRYKRYCDRLEALVDSGKKSKANQDEILQLTLLIEKYDAEHNTFRNADPIELLKSLMKNHKMKEVDLADLLEVSKGPDIRPASLQKKIIERNVQYFIPQIQTQAGGF